MATEKVFTPPPFAKTLLDVAQNTLQKMANSLTATKDPELIERPIIEYDSRMRVVGMEKFNAPCYVSAINFYLSKEDSDKHNACGALIMFVDEKNAGRLLKALGYRGFDEDDETQVFTKCGEFLKTLAESYNSALSPAGYRNLLLSSAVNYRNTVPEGVEFHYDLYKKYEISFYYWKEKTMVLEVALIPAP